MNTLQIRVSQTISAVVIAIALGWSGPADAACSTDLDCKGDRVCDNGFCVNPTTPAAGQPVSARGRAVTQCTGKADCKGDQVCNHGQCVSPLPAAVSPYQMACDGGDMQGCRELGNAYFNGAVVPKDEKRAADLYQRACNGGDSRSCAFLGVMYEKGETVRKDEKLAAGLYRKSCEGGDELGCRQQRKAAICTKDSDCKDNRVCSDGACAEATRAVVPLPVVVDQPVVTPPPPAACFPSCRAGYLCNQGLCVSACNPPCGPDQECGGNGRCAQTWTPTRTWTPVPEVAADPGWARGAGVTGFILTPIALGFAIASAVATQDAVNHHSGNAVPVGLGVVSTLVSGIGVPIVAGGGGSARRHPEVRGVLGLRIAGWISYGLFMADALALIGMGAASVDPGESPIILAGALGAFSMISMAIDAVASASQANSMAPTQSSRVSSVEISPFLAPTARSLAGGAHGAVTGVLCRF